MKVGISPLCFLIHLQNKIDNTIEPMKVIPRNIKSICKTDSAIIPRTNAIVIPIKG